jgi:hypothetical protein
VKKHTAPDVELLLTTELPLHVEEQEEKMHSDTEISSLLQIYKQLPNLSEDISSKRH